MLRAQQLGRYHLLDRIAYGGMAEIFRAKTFDSQGGDRLVAVKRVLPHLCRDQDMVQMMVDEARVSALLRHPNITAVYEFAHQHGQYYMAMEYVDGCDARRIIDGATLARERDELHAASLPIAHVAWIARSVAEGLHAAHTQRDLAGRPLRIVHRDVSPSNMLCSYRGEVKLCDFGIAKATVSKAQTQTGMIKGKVRYMSPEQALGRRLDHRSDLFSLGTTLYEMLTLTPPFTAASEVDLIFAVRDAKPRPVEELRPEIPEALGKIIRRCMAKRRGARFQSGSELADALAAYLDEHHPGYRRRHFAEYMRETFAAEIEADLRLLESYVLEDADLGAHGENLIADVLESASQAERFAAAPPGGSKGHSGMTRVPGEEDEELAAGIARRRGELPEPATDRDVTLHPNLGQSLSSSGSGNEPTPIGGVIHELGTAAGPAPLGYDDHGDTDPDRPAGRESDSSPAAKASPAELTIHEMDTGKTRRAAIALGTPGQPDGARRSDLEEGRSFHDLDTGKRRTASPASLGSSRSTLARSSESHPSSGAPSAEPGATPDGDLAWDDLHEEQTRILLQPKPAPKRKREEENETVELDEDDIEIL